MTVDYGLVAHSSSCAPPSLATFLERPLIAVVADIYPHLCARLLVAYKPTDAEILKLDCHVIYDVIDEFLSCTVVEMVDQ